MARQFKTQAQQTFYAESRRMGVDPTSEYFDREGNPRGHALHRIAYWRGREGARCTWERGTIAYACWAAGADDRKEVGPPPRPLKFTTLP